METPSHKSRPPAKAVAGRKDRQRTPGRPSGDAPDLRARVLDAAIDCFVRQGVAATSLRAIATEAHVTPALLHYYFGDKEQLVAALVEERVMPAFAVVRGAILGSDDDVAGLIAGFVRDMAEAVSQHPWLPALWVREVLCEGGALREVVFAQLAPMPQLLAQKFAAAQAQGQLNAELDPRLLVISLVGLTLFPAAGAPIWRRIFDANDIDAHALRDHTIALLDRGLAIPDPTTKDSP
ncbi:TetR/AcrR family transcriptional regulator [Lysobacter yangpyeongensis]|uniref:TetR/AcrR family transcriptional regulator n=1 Tax=Lysobacter yangpyeongensis TaxID=346182 RepID=A0ABW0SM12_9GAMM